MSIFQRLVVTHFSLVCLLGGTSLWGFQNPVQVDAKLALAGPKAAQVVVTLDIESGWHAYGKLSEETPGIETTVKFTFPEGVQSQGELNRPEGIPYSKDLATSLLVGKSIFQQSIAIEPADKDREIVVKVRYQVCNETSCLPPKTVERKIAVPANAEPEIPDDPFEFDSKWFEAPARLTVKGKPLNSFAKKLYPSPAIFDIDNDGQDELVVGDIFGSLNIYESTDSKDDLTWQAHRSLKNSDGKAIKVNNW